MSSDSIDRVLKRRAIDCGKLIAVKRSKNELNVPLPQAGYSMSLISIPYLRCQTQVDIHAVVSLALLNHRSPILEAYGNKLFIMTINVSRFLYTLEAITLRNENTFRSPPIQQALEFYVKTDLKYRCKKVPPNQQFSQFLHRLQSCGYIEYIFDLAREVNVNIDYIVDSKVAARYIKSDDELENPPIGYLTVIHESNTEWYVKTAKDSILC
ncbi:GrBNV gp84-like protein [Tomelloso virus]|uniref:GrBNV gp84-like protein n=1 Tax=Tomelloso virus TaxID=2053981 RepID=A0A2H4T2U0_9VIRU|nr:GrBNV gp84-like protein [Tomelloso virus]ATY70237.1 GrBNV gp84-like protein [Tomelloso virus]